MPAAPDLLDLLLELQTLDRVPRSGYALRGVPEPESVSEHSFHLAFLVWALAAHEADVDRRRVVEIALVHDLAEVRLGDIPQPGARYLPTGAKRAAEETIAALLLAPLATEGTDLVGEYQAATTPEARFVHACDRLQMLIKVAVYERWGARGLDEFWRAAENFEDGGFGSIRQLVDALRRRQKATAES